MGCTAYYGVWRCWINLIAIGPTDGSEAVAVIPRQGKDKTNSGTAVGDAHGNGNGSLGTEDAAIKRE